MRLREHPGIGEGRTDILPCDPRQLCVMEGFNIRDLSTPEAREELDELKAKVKAHGVRTPLVVKFDGENIFIVEGHKRHKVALELIAEHEASGGAEGRNIDFVPITAEKLGTNDIDRDYGLETSNSGSRLKPLELANLIYRLQTQRGQSLEQIADGLGKSLVVIKNHLAMRAMPEEVKEHVREGDISATEAARLVKNLPAGTDPVKAAEIIKANQEENKKIVGDKKNRSTKVTRKTLERGKVKPEPKAAPVSDPPKPEPESDLTSALAATSETSQPSRIMAPNAEVEPQSDTVVTLRDHDVALAEKHHLPPEAFKPPPSRPRPNTRVDELLFDFVSIDCLTLSGMYSRLCREREEAGFESPAVTPAQEQLCVAADVIGALRFPDEWEQAKANCELAEVA